MSASYTPLQRKTAAAAAALMVIAFVTGVLLGAAMTKKVNADVGAVVAAHLNALFGCLWLAALSFTLPMLRYGDVGKRRLVLGTAIPAYANWLVTTIKSFLMVKGVEPTGDGANDAIFGVLTALVVLPSFVSAIAWTVGLVKKEP
jgi:large-conductance mechanosensitive channel